MKIFNLNKNEFNYKQPKAVVRFIRNFNVNYFSHYGPESDTDLYKILAKFHKVDPKKLFIGPGLENVLIRVVSQIRLKLGFEKVILPSISWEYYEKVLHDYCDFSISKFLVIKDTHSFKYDYDDLEQKINKNPRSLVLLTSPNNPTGHFAESEKLLKIINNNQQNIFLLDEAYAGFGEAKFSESPFIKLLQKNKNVLIGRTLSKFFGLPGLRLGYILGNNKLLSSLSLEPYYLGINVFSSQLAKLILDNIGYYEKVAEKIKKDRNSFFKTINNGTNYQAFDSFANFIIIDCKSKKHAYGIFKLLKNKNILIKKFSSKNLSSFLRITVGIHTTMLKVIKLIKEYQS